MRKYVFLEVEPPKPKIPPPRIEPRQKPVAKDPNECPKTQGYKRADNATPKSPRQGNYATPEEPNRKPTRRGMCELSVKNLSA